MAIKKSFFLIIAPLYMTTCGLVIAQSEDHHTINSTHIAISDDNNVPEEASYQYNPEMWKFIETTFQTVCDQTAKIEFCLQQSIQILNSGKMKFDATKVSKSALLEEIKIIKEMIETISHFYTTSLHKDEAILQGTLFNAAFMSYLLPVITQDIREIKAEDFDKIVSQNFEQFVSNMTSEENLHLLIEENEKNIHTLIQACDTIGLNYFNKIYRFLDTKQIPWYGKSTLATGYDIAYWSTAAAVAGMLAIYVMPQSLKIPFIDGKVIFGDFKIKKWIGDFNQKAREIKGNITPDELKTIQNDSTYISDAHGLVHTYADPFTTTTLGGLAYFTLPYIKESYIAASKKCLQWVNYHFKGDASAIKGSQDFTKAYFKDFVGGEHLEQLAHELADYLKNPLRYERSGIAPSNGYLLIGPSQTGKSFFAKALKTLIDEEFEGSNDKVKFVSISQDDLAYYQGFANLFYLLSKQAPVILFIDEIDMFGVRRALDKKNTQELLTAMNGIDTDPSKKIIVIAATNRPEELDFALVQKGRLGDIISFDYPTYQYRKEYLERQLYKRNITIDQDMIDMIAQETDGQTFNMIDTIVKHAARIATYQTRPVQESDFETALDREIRKIKPNTTLSAAEKELIGIYQAGQAVARHILKTDQKIVKITLDTVDKPLPSKEGFDMISESKGQRHENHDLLPQTRVKPTRLGFIFTISATNNHELLSDTQQEQELLALLAGQAALEIVKGCNFHEFGKEDRAKVLEALEKKIAQGTPITDAIRQQAITAKDNLYQKVKTLLQNKTSWIKIITDALIKNHTINRKQWLALTEQFIQ